MISVVLVDDQELARAGLRTILREPYGFDVVGEASDGRAAQAEVARARPDVVVMDIRMPHMDGVEATRALLAADPACRVLVLTTFGEDGVLAASLRAGARGSASRTPRPRTSSARSARWRRVTAGSIRPSAGGCCGATAPIR